MLEVRRTTKGPLIYVSRTHKNFLRRLFELEVPEIHAGTVEIKAIAREAGTRTKVAVSCRQEGLDPVGATVGQRGGRVQAVVAELGGEKIDVIPWHEDPAVFVANALSPAQVVGVDIDEENRIASVTVPERMLSLAIGREGQNARLAAKLTGWRIDIRSDQAPPREPDAERPGLREAATVAEASVPEAVAAAEDRQPRACGRDTGPGRRRRRDRSAPAPPSARARRPQRSTYRSRTRPSPRSQRRLPPPQTLTPRSRSGSGGRSRAGARQAHARRPPRSTYRSLTGRIEAAPGRSRPRGGNRRRPRHRHPP